MSAAAVTTARSAHRVSYVGWTGHANMGDEAIHQALVGALPGAELVAMPLGLAALRRAPRLVALRHYPVVLGGGTVLGRRIWRFHLRQALTLSRTGDAFMLGAGVEDPTFQRNGHLSEEGELPKWRRLLTRFERVTVRGPRSAELLGDAGVDATVIGDPALLLDLPAGLVTPDDGLIGINLGVSDDLWGHDQARVVEATATAVSILATAGWRFRALVVNPADEADARRCGQLAGLGPAEWEVVAAHDPADYLRAVAPCRLLVAERLHAAVLGVRLGIPTVALEYQPKCRDFLRSVGAEAGAVRTDRVEAGILVDLVRQLDADHDALSARLTEAVDGLRASLAVEADRLARRFGPVMRTA
jgi:polysaccharide pyruvyl transferase WcaK-like protein